MATHQTAATSVPPTPNPELNTTQKASNFASETTSDKSIGFLDVFVHQARDVHNICIYHKQDVYAKLCLTSDPEAPRSTKVVNGGGRNPVFNDSIRLDVHTVDASLKCEIWMLSRVRNYLEDQLLGFALVPLADVIVADGGKLVQEFSLSSTDLFHSPAGFVQLSLSYVGYSPEVIPISPTTKLASTAAHSGKDGSVPTEFDKIEFPDLNVAKENEIMVSEYFSIPCTEIDTLSSESLVTAENGNHLVVESLPKKNVEYKNESPLSCVSTTDSSVVLPATPHSVSEQSANTTTASPTQSQKEKSQETTDGEADSSDTPSKDEVIKPVISINIQPEETVVQQDIVDMYMKSMQQFTESLAKMKLPLDVENNGSSTATSENADSSATEKPSPSPSPSPSSSKGTGSRVFYGSRAFF